MVCGISILAKLGKGIFFVVVRLREQVASSNLDSRQRLDMVKCPLLCSAPLCSALGRARGREQGAVLRTGIATEMAQPVAL